MFIIEKCTYTEYVYHTLEPSKINEFLITSTHTEILSIILFNIHTHKNRLPLPSKTLCAPASYPRRRNLLKAAAAKKKATA